MLSDVLSYLMFAYIAFKFTELLLKLKNDYNTVLSNIKSIAISLEGLNNNSRTISKLFKKVNEQDNTQKNEYVIPSVLHTMLQTFFQMFLEKIIFYEKKSSDAMTAEQALHIYNKSMRKDNLNRQHKSENSTTTNNTKNSSPTTTNTINAHVAVAGD